MLLVIISMPGPAAIMLKMTSFCGTVHCRYSTQNLTFPWLPLFQFFYEFIFVNETCDMQDIRFFIFFMRSVIDGKLFVKRNDDPQFQRVGVSLM